MRASTRRVLLDGPAGHIECALDAPDVAPAGVTGAPVALVTHPHPLHGGTLDNKVTQTLARALVEQGYVTLRPNFRGVGASEGAHDDGRGEVDDLAAVLAWARSELAANEVALAGFSFGAAMQAHLAERMRHEGAAASRMILVGTAVGNYDIPHVAGNTLLVHGELDDTVPLPGVLDWARAQDLPVIVVPGADHFFHRKLHILRGIVRNSWQRA